MSPRSSSVGRLLAALLLLGSCWAQPFAADGGFGRPWEVARISGTSRLGLATGEDGAFAYWSDRMGVMARELREGVEPERLFEGRGVRELAAAQVQGSPAVAWAHRDLETARTRHWLLWRGERRLMVEAAQPYPMSIVDLDDGPGLLYSRREPEGHVLRIVHWGGGETVIRRSDESLARYEATATEDGGLAVAWLEGYTQPGAVGGPISEWTAFLRLIPPGGGAGRTLELGAARNLGMESQTAVGLVDGEPAALWPGPDGEVVYAGAGSEPQVLGYGSPLALSGGEAYWARGNSIRRARVGNQEEAVNVAWSPVTVSRGEVGVVEGASHLLWGGPTRGGDYALYASDDREPMDLGLKDRIAAVMGWSPWGFWEALVGQVLGSLFAGMIVSMVLAPVLLLGAMLAVKTGAASTRGTVAGLVVGAVTLLALLALAAARSRLGEVHVELFGTVPELMGSMVVAAAATYLVRMRSDSEQMLSVLASGWLFLFLSVSILAFLTFQSWLAYWSGMG